MKTELDFEIVMEDLKLGRVGFQEDLTCVFR